MRTQISTASRNLACITLCMIIMTTPVSADPGISNAVYSLFYTGQYDSVIVALNTLKQDDPQNIEINILLGDAYQKLQRWHEAIECYGQVYQAQPNHRSNIMEYASVLQKVGYTQRAQNLLKEALSADSSDTDMMRMLARLYFEELNFSGAVHHYDELLSIDSSNANDHLMLARCAIKLNQPDRAIQHLGLAHTHDPINSRIIYEYARLLHLTDRDAEALELIGQCNTEVRSDQKFILLQGNCRYGLGDYKQAASYLELALEFQPDNIDLIKKLGFCYYADKDFEKAYHQFLLSEPYADDPATYYYLGLCAQELSLKKAAVAYLDKALTLAGPKYLPHLYLALGQCHHDLREYPQAIKSFKQALDVTQDDAMIYYSLANTYNDYYLDKSVALNYYRKALEQGLPPEIEPYIKQQILYLQNQVFFGD